MSVIYIIIAAIVILLGVLKFRKGTINDDELAGYFLVGIMWPIAFILIAGWYLGGFLVIGLENLTKNLRK